MIDPRISDLERAYVTEVLDGQFRTSAGNRMCSRLEQTFADMMDVRYAISMVNGTTTLHAALVAVGVEPWHEVIVPPLTMSSPALSVLQVGAVPVFADVDPDTFQIDAASIAARITPRTRAIMTVGLYGMGPDMDAVLAVANRHGLPVIEDNAEIMLARDKGRLLGTLGAMASFSFQSSKHLTSGEGGMLITNDPELASRARRFGSLGYATISAGKGRITKIDIQDPGYARHTSPGFNYRMPELCAAVALAQVERATDLVARRCKAAEMLRETVADCSWLVPQAVPDGVEHSYWTLAVRLVHPQVSWHRFRDTFVAHGGKPPYAAWLPSHLEPLFANGYPLRLHPDYTGPVPVYGPGLCPVAERLQPTLIQFTTNLWTNAQIEAQTKSLRRTITALER